QMRPTRGWSWSSGLCHVRAGRASGGGAACEPGVAQFTRRRSGTSRAAREVCIRFVSHIMVVQRGTRTHAFHHSALTWRWMRRGTMGVRASLALLLVTTGCTTTYKVPKGEITRLNGWFVPDMVIRKPGDGHLADPENVLLHDTEGREHQFTEDTPLVIV